MPPHPLTNFEIQKYYQNELKFNDVYTRNILSKIKHGAYIKNLDKYESTGTDWMALYVNAKSLTYVDSFGVEHIPKEIRKFIENKKVATNIYRIQAYSIIKYEIRNYLIEEINQNKLMNRKYKNVCRVFNYTDHSLIVVSTITGCVSISAFACLVGIQQGLRILQLELKNCAITARIERYKSKIKKKKKRHHKIVLLAKSKLKSIEILISKALIQSNISHDEFLLINKVLKELCDFQEEMEKSYNK